MLLGPLVVTAGAWQLGSGNKPQELQKFMDFYKERAALATATSNALAAMGVELNTEGNLFSGGEARDRRSKRKRGGGGGQLRR